MKKEKKFVRKLEHWIVSQGKSEAVLGINMSLAQDAVLDSGYKDFTNLKVSLKGYSNVSKELPVYIYKYNIGINQYAPVPGDETQLIKDANKDELPDTTDSFVMDGVTYGYTNVNVGGTVFYYYVNANANPKWFVKMGNDGKKYVYDKTSKTYSVLSN